LLYNREKADLVRVRLPNLLQARFGHNLIYFNNYVYAINGVKTSKDKENKPAAFSIQMMNEGKETFKSKIEVLNLMEILEEIKNGTYDVSKHSWK